MIRRLCCALFLAACAEPATPAAAPGGAVSAEPAASPSTPPPPAAAAAGPVEKGPFAPYRLSLTPSAVSASTREEVTVAWKIEGGPRVTSGVVPRVRLNVEWVDVVPPKPGAKPEPKSPPQSFPADPDVCAAAPLARSIAFAMQPKRTARIQAEVVGCQGRAAAEETRAKAVAGIDWVAPYVAEVDVPAVLTAGSTTQGTIRFRGVDGPGAPPAVKITSNHPGITITRQPTVAATSTFDIVVKPDANGEARLTAEHVDTNGSGRILGILRKTAVVRVQPPRK